MRVYVGTRARSGLSLDGETLWRSTMKRVGASLWPGCLAFQQICSPNYAHEATEGRISRKLLVVQFGDKRGLMRMTLGGRVFLLVLFVHLPRTPSPADAAKL